MKTEYTPAEMEILLTEEEDIIVTSWKPTANTSSGNEMPLLPDPAASAHQSP